MRLKEGIKISQFEKAPLRHRTLPANLVARIENLATTFAEVDGRPAAEWIEDFQRDQHPDNEITVWEGMAAAYALFAKDRSLDLQAKKEAFNLLLLRSMSSGPLSPEGLRSKRLTHDDAIELLRIYDNLINAKIGAV